MLGAVSGEDHLVTSRLAVSGSGAVSGGNHLVASPVGAAEHRESTLRHTILFSGHDVMIGTFALLLGAVFGGDHLVASPVPATVLGLLSGRRTAE